MAVPDSDWLPLRVAAERYGVSYWTLWRLQKSEAFTRGIFDPAAKNPPVFLSVRELDAYKAGGLAGVRKVQARAKTAKRKAGAGK